MTDYGEIFCGDAYSPIDYYPGNFNSFLRSSLQLSKMSWLDKGQFLSSWWPTMMGFLKRRQFHKKTKDATLENSVLKSRFLELTAHHHASVSFENSLKTPAIEENKCYNRNRSYRSFNRYKYLRSIFRNFSPRIWINRINVHNSSLSFFNYFSGN